jgi:hypothetical protein
VKRYVLGIFAVVALAGGSLAFTGAAAYAQSTTVSSVVGHAPKVKLGFGPTFVPASCSSASPSTVACGLLATKRPQDAVQLWCLSATPPTGVAVTVDYATAPGANGPVSPTTLTVNCALAAVKAVTTPGYLNTKPLTGPFSVTGCSVNVFGANCTYGGKTLSEDCPLQVTANVLPVFVTATVTLGGAPPINGKTVDVFFICA